MPLSPSTKTSRASAAVAVTRAILPACPDAVWWHTHSANVRVFPKPRPASNNQICHQSPGGGSWFGRAIAGQEFSRASASCAAKELAIDHSSLVATIRQRGRRSARRVEITQRRNHRLARLRIGRHRAHDPSDRSRIIGIDQNIVLDIQQRAALQLTGQAAAIPEILVQPPREKRQRIAVPHLRGGGKPFVKRSADNAVMVDQRERFVRRDLAMLKK